MRPSSTALHDVSHAVIDANDSLTITMDGDREVVAVFGCGGGSELELLLLGIGLLALIHLLRRR